MASAPKKSSGLKIVLIVLAVIVGTGLLAVVACVGSGYFWVKRNAPELMEAAEQARADAETYAATATQNECVDEGLRRHDACGQGMALSCRTQARVFTDFCLRQASATPGLCDGVPSPTEIMAGASWARRYCDERGRVGDQHCPNFVRAVVEHCGRVR